MQTFEACPRGCSGVCMACGPLTRLLHPAGQLYTGLCHPTR